MDELVTTDKPAPQAAEMRPYTRSGAQGRGAGETDLRRRQGAGSREPARLVSRRHVRHPRHHRSGRWLESLNAVYADGRKRVYYLSLEFLIGRLLFDAMTNLGVAAADGGSAR